MVTPSGHRHHDVFRATLRIDELVHIASHWTFRVYDDGTLTVEIQRPDNWRLQRNANDDDPERREQELAYSFVAFDGAATPLVDEATSSPSTAPDNRPRAYSCTFYLAKCGAEGESWTVEFSGRLVPHDGFHGHWTHDAHQDYRLWQPRFEETQHHTIPSSSAWVAAVEPVGATLAPLTSGSYTLEGSLMDDENVGFIVPLSVQLTLHIGGLLTGTSTSAWGSTRDDGEPETALLSGTWTRTSIDMVQRFAFPDAPNEVFALHGDVRPYGMTGVWSVVELEALGDWEDSERQRFHLHVTSMQRPWSVHEHAYFPTTFRAAVRVLLLSSLQARGGAVRLPSALWPRVLAYCDSEWFH